MNEVRISSSMLVGTSCVGSAIRAGNLPLRRPSRQRFRTPQRQGIVYDLTNSAGDFARLFAAFLHFCQRTGMRTLLTVTSRGVVTLPVKLRRALGLKADDQIIAETTPEGLLLRPSVTLPVEMYTEKRIREFDEAEADLARFIRRKKRSAR
jgi:bifunctional DNA-binding transcriptional regulator/antitoxin component of YhaV-PrlF toxin-antitoxin module